MYFFTGVIKHRCNTFTYYRCNLSHVCFVKSCISEGSVLRRGNNSRDLAKTSHCFIASHSLPQMRCLTYCHSHSLRWAASLTASVTDSHVLPLSLLQIRSLTDSLSHFLTCAASLTASFTDSLTASFTDSLTTSLAASLTASNESRLTLVASHSLFSYFQWCNCLWSSFNNFVNILLFPLIYRLTSLILIIMIPITLSKNSILFSAYSLSSQNNFTFTPNTCSRHIRENYMFSFSSPLMYLSKCTHHSCHK